MKLVALVLACCALFSTSRAAQDVTQANAPAKAAEVVQQPPPPSPVKCIKCKSFGRLPCGEHTVPECEAELEVLYCSQAAACTVCSGVGWIDCPECEMPAVPQWIAARKLAIAAHKPTLKYIDDAMGREVRKGESPHFVLVWEMEDMKVEKVRRTPHELLHLYLKRLETMFADFRARLQVDDSKFPGKPNLYVWFLPADQQRASESLCNQPSKRAAFLHGNPARYSTSGNKQYFLNDEKLHRSLVHITAQLLLGIMEPSYWMGNIKGGWMDEGIAHFFEDRYWGICDNYCYQEQNTNTDFKGGKYRVAVRKLVADGMAPSLSETFQQNIDTLTLPMHAVSMSIVDYLINKDGAKFYELSKLLKSKVPTAEALQQVYGMRPLELEGLWKSHVLTTYPTR